MSQYLRGPPRKHPAILRKLDVHLGLFFFTGETMGLGDPVSVLLCSLWEVQYGQSEIAPITILLHYVLGFCGPKWML